MAISTAIRDRSELTVEHLKAQLGLQSYDAVDETGLTRCLAAAKTKADSYCDSEFLDADGEEDAIPQDVEDAVLRLAAELYLRRVNGVTTNKVGDLELSFDTTRLEEDLREALFPYRDVRGF